MGSRDQLDRMILDFSHLGPEFDAVHFVDRAPDALVVRMVFRIFELAADDGPVGGANGIEERLRLRFVDTQHGEFLAVDLDLDRIVAFLKFDGPRFGPRCACRCFTNRKTGDSGGQVFP